MTYSIQEIANNIKVARIKKGLSQRALSIKIGVPQSHISKIENGLVDLQISSLIEIARALDLEVVLIPRHLMPAVFSLENTEKSLPAYRLPDEDNDDDT